MAISALPSPSRSIVADELMPGGCLPVVTTRFFQLGFSYQAQVLPPSAMMSGLPSPLMSASSTW